MRISVTMIDNYRKLLEDYYSDDPRAMTEEKLIKWITEPSTSEYMSKGSAFHEILEHHSTLTPENGYYHNGGFSFSQSDIEECIGVISDYGTAEIKDVKIYDIDGEEIQVVGKADLLIGSEIEEHKTVWTGYKYRRYEESVQWRFYLEIFEASVVRYNIFEFSDTAKAGIKLKNIHQFELYPYETMSQELACIVRGFVAWIHSKGLEEYFKNKSVEEQCI